MCDLVTEMSQLCEALVQTIRFDDFQVWTGKCAPEDEPFPNVVTFPKPVWPSMLTKVVFSKAFTGGGCATFEVQNTAAVPCDMYELELNIRPEWGTILQKEGVLNLQRCSLLEQDEAAGEILQACTCCTERTSHLATVAGWLRFLFICRLVQGTVRGKEHRTRFN
jgi:hypothetical protein